MQVQLWTVCWLQHTANGWQHKLLPFCWRASCGAQRRHQVHKHATCSPEVANNAARSYHSCPHLSTCCSCTLRDPAAPAGCAASSDAATSPSNSKSPHSGCALHASDQRYSSRTHKNQASSSWHQHEVLHIQTAQSSVCCFVVPLQLHDKFAANAAPLGQGHNVASQVPTRCCWVLSRTKDRQLTCTAPQHVPAGVCPVRPGVSSCPCLGLMGLPCSLAAIWPIRAEHSRCRLCSAPAVPTRVRNRAPPGLLKRGPCQTSVGKELQRQALHQLSTRSAEGIKRSICQLPAFGGCSCAWHWPEPGWLGNLCVIGT